MLFGYNLLFFVQAPTKWTMLGCRPACLNIFISLRSSELSVPLEESIYRRQQSLLSINLVCLTIPK